MVEDTMDSIIKCSDTTIRYRSCYALDNDRRIKENEHLRLR